MAFRTIRAAAAVGVAAFSTSCAAVQDSPRALISDLAAPNWRINQSAPFIDASGARIGKLSVVEAPAGVLIRIDIAGLTPGWHGLHLHQSGDCSDGAAGFKASGGHVNPAGVAHGLLNANGAHLADLPNVYADESGRATAEFFRPGVTIADASKRTDGRAALLDADGTALIIHARPDDHETQPIGGAGARVACAALIL